MNQYVTGSIIKKLREMKKLTQLELAEKLCVSEKTISKWENGRGYPDITILEELAQALGISVLELFSGNDVTNENRSFHMSRCKFYVCPVCGNVLCSSGEAVISCCGVVLPPLEPEKADEEHMPQIEIVEDEYFVDIPHEMSKQHYLSFIASVRDNRVEIVKLYPESEAQTRFKLSQAKDIYYYCNRHGLYHVKIKRFPGKKSISII